MIPDYAEQLEIMHFTMLTVQCKKHNHNYYLLTLNNKIRECANDIPRLPRSLKSRDIKPVIVPDHQLYSLTQDSEVLHALVNISHTLGDLKLHSIPVVDLRKQAEQVPGQEHRLLSLWLNILCRSISTYPVDAENVAWDEQLKKYGCGIQYS